jgi:hypothetical protein
MSKADNKCCGNCKWYDAPLNKNGKRYANSHLARYLAPLPELPTLPKSIPIDKAWDDGGLKWPPGRMYMARHQGTDCPVFEHYKEPTDAQR